jgi:succinyl-diaminopimelate desuccinylase
MNAFLNELRKAFSIPTQQVWETTVNLSRIETNNQAFNKIPDECAVWLDIRFVPEDKSILERIYKLTPPDFNIEIVANESELLVEEDNPYLVRLKKVTEDVLGRKIKFYGANGSSDARHFTKVGDKGVEFGPIGGEPGTDEEWVDIDSLVTYYEVLKKYLFEFNG